MQGGRTGCRARGQDSGRENRMIGSFKPHIRQAGLRQIRIVQIGARQVGCRYRRKAEWGRSVKAE